MGANDGAIEDNGNGWYEVDCADRHEFTLYEFTS